MSTKREKTKAVLAAVSEWVKTYLAGEEGDESEYEACCENLVKAYKELAEHEAQARVPVEDHPGGEYYEITLDEQKVRMVRCKHCGTEMNPRGFKRHYKSPACETARALRLGLEAPAKPAKSKKEKKNDKKKGGNKK